MKRKILAIMLSSMLAFSFTACGNTEETADGTVTNAEADVDVADTGTDAEWTQRQQMHKAKMWKQILPKTYSACLMCRF